MHICRFLPPGLDEFRVKLGSCGWCTKCRAYDLIKEASECIDDPSWNDRAQVWLRYVDQDSVFE